MILGFTKSLLKNMNDYQKILSQKFLTKVKCRLTCNKAKEKFKALHSVNKMIKLKYKT